MNQLGDNQQGLKKCGAARSLAKRLGLPLLLLAFVSSVPGCGLPLVIADILLGDQKKKKTSADDDDDDDSSEATSLGVAAFPAGTKSPKAKHSWVAPKLEPSRYELSYAISRAEQDKILAAHALFAKKAGYTPLGGGRFRWKIPPGCERDFGCAFGAMSDASTEALKPLVSAFRKRRDKKNLNAIELSNLIVTFVQDIKYERPGDQPFDILPPASVVAESRGDCDSKSLLAHLLLREFGIDSLMLSSQAHAHAMLGIAVPAPGKRFTFGGRSYAFTELTAKASPIGHINPRLLQPDDWKVVPTRWPESWWTGQGNDSESGR